jgi:uncharacterized protein
MSDHVNDTTELPAGGFSAWVARTLDALSGGGGSEVPCGGCTACCRSSYFIHIGPDETDTLGRIPRALLFPAPGLPDGHVVLGYDERGCCPMLVDDRCSIYEDRPRTCRTYDCRVFAAAGVAPEDDGKPLIAARVRRWRFDLATTIDRAQHEAVRATAVYLRRHPECFPGGAAPSTGVDLAVAAVKAHGAILAADHGPDPVLVRESLRG